MQKTPVKSDRTSFAGCHIGYRRFADFAVTESIYSPGQYIPHHSHQSGYISLALSGTYTEKCDRHLFDVQPGHVILHFAGESHSNQFHDKGGRLLNLEMSPAIWSRLVGRDSGVPNTKRVRRSPYALQLGLRLQREISSSDAASSWAMEGLMMELVAETIRERAPKLETERANWLDKVTEILKERYREPILLKEIASTVSVHPVHLARAFRKRHHCSIGDYLRKLRAEAACQDLLHSQLSMAEVALQSGFSDQSHLCRILKQQTGLSPGQIRELRGSSAAPPLNSGI